MKTTFGLQTKILVLVGFILFVGLGTSTVIHIQRIKQNYLKALEWRSEVLAQTILIDTEHMNLQGVLGVLSLRCSQMYRLNKDKGIAHLSVIDASGEIVAHNDMDLLNTPVESAVLLEHLRRQENATVLDEEIYHTFIPIVRKKVWLGAIDIGVPERVVNETVQETLTLRVTEFVVLISMLTLFLTMCLRKLLIQPVNRILTIANAISEGDLTQDITIRQNDEIGRLAEAFRRMKDKIIRVLQETEHLTEMIRDGHLDVRGNAESFTGSWKTLVIGINNVIDTFVSPFRVTAEYIDRIAVGDIPGRIAGDYKGDFNTIRDNLNTLSNAMETTTQVAEAIASGDLNTDVRERSEHDRMMQALNRMIHKLNQIMDETNGMIRSVREGRSDVRGNAASFEGGWRNLVTGVNDLINTLSDAVTREAAMSTEMELAKQIQTALLPKELEHEDLEIEAAMIPADEVGGDFYDVLNGHGDQLWLGIGDVSGHGVTPGLIMMMAQTANTVIARNFEQSPRDVVVGINDLLYQNVHERLGSDHFMTFTALKYLGQGRFEHAGAHLPMIAYRRETGQCEIIPTKGTFLNFVADVSKITENSAFGLGIGDILVMYTDGLTEAKDPEGRLLGSEGLTKLVEAHADKDTPAFRDAVLDDVLTWCDHEREDDFTLVVVRRIT